MATQQCLLRVRTYGAGTPIAGVLAPRARLGFRGAVGRRQQLGFVAPPALAPHYMDPTNGASRQRPIRVLIFLGSISGPHMIASWAYHQQSPTCTRDNHIGKLSFQPVKCVTRKVYV